MTGDRIIDFSVLSCSLFLCMLHYSPGRTSLGKRAEVLTQGQQSGEGGRSINHQVDAVIG